QSSPAIRYTVAQVHKKFKYAYKYHLTLIAHLFSPCLAMKSTSVQVCKRIISLIDSGLSSRQIGEHLGFCHKTVLRVRESAMRETQKSKGRRPAKLTTTDKRRWVRMIIFGKADNTVQVAREMKDTTSVEPSHYMMRRALKEAGLKAAVKKRKPR